jgi:hypothetical protein
VGPAPEEPWLVWLAEAHQIIQAWEVANRGRLLTATEAAQLAEFVAKGLSGAFERGADGTAPPPA